MQLRINSTVFNFKVNTFFFLTKKHPHLYYINKVSTIKLYQIGKFLIIKTLKFVLNKNNFFYSSSMLLANFGDIFQYPSHARTQKLFIYTSLICSNNFDLNLPN